jgi:hypothetical protein
MPLWQVAYEVFIRFVLRDAYMRVFHYSIGWDTCI